MVEESVYTIRGWLWEYKPCWLGENRKQLLSSFSKGVTTFAAPATPGDLHIWNVVNRANAQSLHKWGRSSELTISFWVPPPPPKSLSNFTVDIWKKSSFWKEVVGCVNREKYGCTRKAGWWVWVLGNACICRVNSCITKKNIWGWVNRSSQMLDWSRTHFSCPGKCSCSAKIWNILFLLFCLVLGFQVYEVSYCIFRQNKIHLIWWRQICRVFSDFNE